MERFMVSFLDEYGNSILFYNKEISRNWVEVESSEEVNSLTKNMFEKSNAIYASIMIIDENNKVKNRFKIFKYQEKVCEEMKN